MRTEVNNVKQDCNSLSIGSVHNFAQGICRLRTSTGTVPEIFKAEQ